MKRYNDAAISVYLSGLMDPGEEREFEEAAERSLTLRRRVRAFRGAERARRLSAAASLPDLPWWIQSPPHPLFWPISPTIPRRGLEAEVRESMSFDAGIAPFSTFDEFLSPLSASGVKAGTAPPTLEVLLRPSDALMEIARQVVILVMREDYQTEVLTPTSDSGPLPLSEQRMKDGWIFLEVNPPKRSPGALWAITFPPLALPLDWGAPAERRWSALFQSLRSGEHPWILFGMEDTGR